jgi:PAS domain S-box-containing protein
METEMKRNQSGQFINSWDEEAKQKVSLSLTATAWDILDKRAREQGLSKSELVERFARSLEDESDREHERLLQQVKTNFNQLKAVFDTMTEGLIIADLDGNLLEFNPAALAIHGFESLEQVRHHFAQFFDRFEVRDTAGNFVPLEQWAMSRVVRGESYSGYELQIHRSDTGKTFIASYSGAPVYDAHGNITLAIVTMRDITAQKQAQADLVRSQQRLESTLNAIPHAIWVVGSDQNFCFSNQQWLNYYGISVTEAMATGWNQVHPDDLVTVQQRWKVAKETRSPYEAEFRWRFADGSERWYLCRALPMLDEAGQIVEWLGSNTDITQLKQVEAELKQSQQFIQQVAEMLPGLLYVYDLTEYRNVYVNRESAEVLGYTPEQIQAMGASLMPTLIHPDDFAQMVALQESIHAQKPGEVAELEYRMRHANGEWRWILDRGVVFNRTPDGRARQILGFAIDISDRKQIEDARKIAEIALRDTEERLKRALDAARMVAWEWSADTNRVIYSQTAIEIFGVRSETEIRTSEAALALMHPEDVSSYRQAVLSAMSSGQSYIAAFRWMRPDTNEIVWMEDRGNVYMNAIGCTVKVAGMVTDISNRVRLEQERDRILQQEQTARKSAETANRLKDEFLMVLSHELRTPLNPILGWLKFLRAGRLSPEKTREVLATIERNAQLQAQLIEDLLDVSKILRGKLTLNLIKINLAIPTAAAVETVQLLADTKHITIETKINDAIVSGDASRLQQVVWNLLSNAVKFTPENGRIELSLTQVGEMAQIQVKDTGKGISPEFLPHVFEHFRQQDSSTTRQFGGLGLGLAIVRQITELHGGTVFSESQGEGQGAIFTVQFPLCTN